jgi:hypothetical protein
VKCGPYSRCPDVTRTLRPKSQISKFMPDLRTFDNSVSTKSTERWCLTRCLHRWCAVNPCDVNRYCTVRSHSPSSWAKRASMTVRCRTSLARGLTAISRTSALKVWHRASNSQWEHQHGFLQLEATNPLCTSFADHLANPLLRRRSKNTVFLDPCPVHVEGRPEPEVEPRVVRFRTTTAERTVDTNPVLDSRDKVS